MTKIHILILGVIILITSCNKSGKNFTGNWEHTSSPSATLNIQDQGDYYSIEATSKNMFTGKPETSNYQATLKEGVLIIDEMIDIRYDKKTGNLIAGDDSYKKIP